MFQGLYIASLLKLHRDRGQICLQIQPKETTKLYSRARGLDHYFVRNQAQPQASKPQFLRLLYKLLGYYTKQVMPSVFKRG
jgi:hypothetical protein